MIGFEDLELQTWVEDCLTIPARARVRNFRLKKRRGTWSTRLAIPMLVAFSTLAVPTSVTNYHAASLTWQLSPISIAADESLASLPRLVSAAGALLRSLVVMPVSAADEARVERLVSERLAQTTSRALIVRR